MQSFSKDVCFQSFFSLPEFLTPYRLDQFYGFLKTLLASFVNSYAALAKYS